MVTLLFMACWLRFLLAATLNWNSTSRGQRLGQRPMILKNACQCYGLRSYGAECMLMAVTVLCCLPRLDVVCGLIPLLPHLTGT